MRVCRHQNPAKEMILRRRPVQIPGISWYETQQGLTVMLRVHSAGVVDDLLAIRQEGLVSNQIEL